MSNLIRFGVSLEEELLKKFDRHIKEFAYAGKIHDAVKTLLQGNFWYAEDRAVQENVFAPGQFGMKSRAQFKQ